MRLRVPVFAVVLLAVAPSAFAARTWYGHYLDARDKHIPARKWKEALANLEEAIKLKPDSELLAQTYGLEFVDYFPYYHMGKVQLASGEFNSAIRMFNIEASKGKIRSREALYRDMLKLRADAEAQQKGVDTAENVRKLSAEVDRLRREAGELHRQGRFEDALARLAQAQEAAQVLDPGTQADISSRAQRIRDEMGRAAEALARTRRIEKDLSDGLKLLQDGKPTEAKLKFESVLALEPAQAAALDGKRRAEEQILASTTLASREALLREGRKLFESGRYEEALLPLAEAASDRGAAEAQDLLGRARKILEGIQKAKDDRLRVEELMAEGEALMEGRRYADAYVRFGTVLQLDPGNVKAPQRQRLAGQLTGEEIFTTLFPNTAPVLSFLVPGGQGPVVSLDTEGQKVQVVGAAFDDRGLAQLRFYQDGRLVAEQDLLDPRTSELPRNHQINRTFELAVGPNQIRVVAVDSLGATQEQAFYVLRTLPIHLRPWFMPSAAATSAALLGLGYAVQRTRRRRAVRARFNPYIAGAPVREDDMFFGRQKLLARILNVLHHNSLMITGERRIGKTTLLHHLRKALEHDEGTEYQFYPVSTDLQGVPESGFFDAVMTDVIEQARPKPETMAALRFRPDREAYDGRDFSHDLQRIVEELTTRTPKKVKLVLLIDEVDVLNEYSERINQRLRSIFMKTYSEHLVAIMSGVGIKRVWKSEGSPWYNFFDEIELTAFSREEAEALVRQPVEGVFRWSAEAVEAILENSGLKPYVIQKFCIHAVNHMLEEGRTTITAADVEAVRPAVLFERPEEIASVPETASA
ncbi:MAG TPA: AAA family ATPase [Vicinamibacteria bacterium]|nr:AAA family ATPase [Vicinamibacteria bacterium]